MKRVSRRRFFITSLLMFFVSAGLCFGGSASAFAAESSGKAIVIRSPSDGEVIHGNSVDVIFELRNKGSRGDHVHLYLDGRLVKPLHGRKITYTINQLKSGTHTIVIRLATKSHQILEPQDSVTVEVR